MDHTKNPSEASEIEKCLFDDAYALKCSCMVGKTEKEKIRPKPDFSDFCKGDYLSLIATALTIFRIAKFR